MPKEKVAKSSEFYTVCMTPDMCKVQAGAAIVVLPFIVKGEFKEAENVSPNVKARGCPVVWKEESTIPHVTGDAGGNQFGVKSQTKEGEAKAVCGLASVTVNGHEIVRVGDMCTLNNGNTFGKIFYRGAPTPSLPGAKPKAPSLNTPQGQTNAVLRQAAAGAAGGIAPMAPSVFEKQPGDKQKGKTEKDKKSPKAQKAIGAAGAMAGSLGGGEKKQDVVQMPPPEAPKQGAPPESTVHGKGVDPGRCKLKAYSEGCPGGKTPHHVIPDRVYRFSTKAANQRIAGAPQYSEGLCICVDGSNLDPNKEHGKIHKFYDHFEERLGKKGKPQGTAKMGVVERLAARSAARETGCDSGYLHDQLMKFNRNRGIEKKDAIRADPRGEWKANYQNMKLGSGSGTQTGWTTL